MARPKNPAARTLLIERAALMLRTREPITLRSLVAGTGVSTMAVYTHFGGMDGVWRALRQEGFARLGERLESVTPSADPVRDLSALVAGYVANALDHPDLFRVMFDPASGFEDVEAAEATLEHLVRAAGRAREAGRFGADVDPRELVNQSWAIAHGLVSLVATGPLRRRSLDDGIPLLTALFVSAGDEPDRSRASVEQGWRQLLPAHAPSPDG